MPEFSFDSYREENGGPTLIPCDETPLKYYAKENGKVIPSFGFDLFACYAAMKLLEAHGIGYDVDASIDEGRLVSPKNGGRPWKASDGREVTVDDVFEKCTCLCEFYLNRLTSKSDRSIKDYMVHIRFTLSRLLDIDPESERHILCEPGSDVESGKIGDEARQPRSLARFYRGSRKGDRYDQDELRQILNLEYDSRRMESAFGGRTELASEEIVEGLNLTERCRAYYSTLISCLNGRGRGILVSLGSAEAGEDGAISLIKEHPDCVTVGDERMIPLLGLIEYLRDQCRCIPGGHGVTASKNDDATVKTGSGIAPLSYHAASDEDDIKFGRIADCDALIGRKGVRDTDMESTTHHLANIHICPDCRKVLMDLIWFVRLLKCIMSDSDIRNHRVRLRFDPSSLMTLMDPDIFGKSYVHPSLYFVESEGLVKEYNSMIASVGTHENRARGVSYFGLPILENLMNRWKSTENWLNNPDRRQDSFCLIARSRNIGFKDHPDQNSYEEWSLTGSKTHSKGCSKPGRRSRTDWLTGIFALGGIRIVSKSNYHCFEMVERRGTGVDATEHVIETIRRSNPLIFATGAEMYPDLILKLSNPDFDSLLPLINMIVVVDRSKSMAPAIVRNEYTLMIPVVTVSRLKDLFDIHTGYLFPNMKHAAEKVLGENTSGEGGFQMAVRSMIEEYCTEIRGFADMVSEEMKRIEDLQDNGIDADGCEADSTR